LDSGVGSGVGSGSLRDLRGSQEQGTAQTTDEGLKKGSQNDLNKQGVSEAIGNKKVAQDGLNQGKKGKGKGKGEVGTGDSSADSESNSRNKGDSELELAKERLKREFELKEQKLKELKELLKEGVISFEQYLDAVKMV
jgi:hypothetical protein